MTEPIKDEGLVKADTVYREMYAEMRRYRDYELKLASWFSTLAFAYLGGVFFLHYSVSPPVLGVECTEFNDPELELPEMKPPGKPGPKPKRKGREEN